MKVKNPNPCLVNVAGANGKFIRIGPLQVADVDAKAVARLLKTGALVKASGEDDSPVVSPEPVAPEPVAPTPAPDGGIQPETPAVATKTANKK